MKIFFKMLLLLVSLSGYSATYAVPLCDTHQSCNMGETCSCTIPANSAYNRYYYFDVVHFEKGKHYSCELSSTPLTDTFDSANLPDGVSYHCTKSCSSFPTSLLIDTTQMKNISENGSIKYWVPASDMASEVTLKCTS